jgi:hypothetical protein
LQVNGQFQYTAQAGHELNPNPRPNLKNGGTKKTGRRPMGNLGLGSGLHKRKAGVRIPGKEGRGENRGFKITGLGLNLGGTAT